MVACDHHGAVTAAELRSPAPSVSPIQQAAPAVPTLVGPPSPMKLTKDQKAAALVNCHVILSMVASHVVKVVLSGDTPAPECALVRLDQRLLIVNPQSRAAILRLGRLRRVVAARSQGSIQVDEALDRPGGYLLHVGGTDYLPGAVNIGVVVHSP